MSTAISLGTVLPGPQRRELGAWWAWLEQHVAHDWRPAEWDPEGWLFTGDIDSPDTSIWKCTTLACTVTVKSPAGHCRGCTKALRVSDLDLETFSATHRPVISNYGRAESICEVRRGREQCPRTVGSLGLCRSHYSLWHKHVAKDPTLLLEVWARTVPEPLPQLPSCLVLRCGEQQISPAAELCAYHYRRWQRHCRDTKIPESSARERTAWADGQSPYLNGHQFSLRHLAPGLRLEILYAVQEREARCGMVDPSVTRWIADSFDPGAESWLSFDHESLVARYKHLNVLSQLRQWDRDIRLKFDEFCGVDPVDKMKLDLVAIGLKSTLSRTGRRTVNRVVDLHQITQPWLRQILVEWIRAARPEGGEFSDTFRAIQLVSPALACRPSGGADPALLQLADMDAAVDAIRIARRRDGELYGAKFRRDLLTKFFGLLDFGRGIGLMDAVAGGFGRQITHRIPDEDVDEDEVGKAIPESVIRQLDAHLDRLGAGFAYGGYAREDIEAMFQAAYVVVRDTGRRPGEVCKLPVDCLKVDGAEFDLLWDNHKARRFRRRLPVASQTVAAIRVWQERRAQMDIPDVCQRYLFPAITGNSGNRHLASNYLSQAIRQWVDAIPDLHAEAADTDGSPLPFDRTLIYTYAFRHSYAQRHADAGVKIDVLRDLMDHRSIQTTMGYYKVTQKRKREAIKTMRLAVIDRTGAPAPMSSNTAYEARSVAVPFGNCIEPSNVKAGGGSCRIRFQCAGCGFYRPDPSYLPPIEDHIRSLKADREVAQAMDADEFVLRNLNDQIDAFQNVVAVVRDVLESLPADERERIEDASRVLRKTRAAEGIEGRVLLPLTVIQREEPVA
ncbi:tyrosine-type recombinase/integrase [Streptomyces sp. NBC_00280]|uniref:tyrosine-type recombinase/integrase n=1 Tax=Streptomyces sp. NBC_00280 TaxID=2975699 RepID=UPI00324E8EE4